MPCEPQPSLGPPPTKTDPHTETELSVLGLLVSGFAKFVCAVVMIGFYAMAVIGSAGAARLTS